MPFDAAVIAQHPLSAAYPSMPQEEFAALVADIRRVGLRQPITIFEGRVLDGWHRHLACLEAGVQAMYVDFDEGDPRDYVISHNGYRRHMTAQQRAQAVVKVMEWKPAGRPSGNSANLADLNPTPSAATMADLAQTGTRNIERAKTIERAGLGNAVRDGVIGATAAERIALSPPEVQAKAKEALDRGERPQVPPAKQPMSELEKLQIENADLRERLADMARDLETYIKVADSDGRIDTTIAGMLAQQKAVESQRDTLLRENAELKREIKSLRRKLGLK